MQRRARANGTGLVRLPTVYLDPRVPEHAAILDRYRGVSKSVKTEWIRLRLLAGVRAMDTEAMPAADVGRAARQEAADVRVEPPMPRIFSEGCAP